MTLASSLQENRSKGLKLWLRLRAEADDIASDEIGEINRQLKELNEEYTKLLQEAYS